MSAPGASVRLTCQYQPDSGSSNSGSPTVGCVVAALSPGSSGVATAAMSVRR